MFRNTNYLHSPNTVRSMTSPRDDQVQGGTGVLWRLHATSQRDLTLCKVWCHLDMMLLFGEDTVPSHRKGLILLSVTSSRDDAGIGQCLVSVETAGGSYRKGLCILEHPWTLVSPRVLDLIPWVLKDDSTNQRPMGGGHWKRIWSVHSGLRELHPQSFLCALSPQFTGQQIGDGAGEGPFFHSGGSTTNHWPNKALTTWRSWKERSEAKILSKQLSPDPGQISSIIKSTKILSPWQGEISTVRHLIYAAKCRVCSRGYERISQTRRLANSM